MTRTSPHRLAALSLATLLLGSLLTGCTSNWKIHGGPKECVEMCNKWDLVFAGMVGVGDQSRTGQGATACVCQVPGPAPTSGGSAASAASLAAPITAAQAAAAAQAAQQQQQQMATQAAAAH